MVMQLIDAILSLNALLLNMLLLDQQTLLSHKRGPSHDLRSLDNTGYWDQQKLLPAVTMQHLSQRPFPFHVQHLPTENTGSWEPSTFEPCNTPEKYEP